MRKTLQYTLLAALACVLAAAFALGLDAGQFQIERSARIDAPSQAVFANLDDLHRWAVWFHWLELDEHVSKHDYSGPTTGVGARYEWESDAKLGRNRIRITESQPAERVKAQLDYTQGRTRRFDITVKLTTVGSGTEARIMLSGPDTYATKLFGRYKDYLGRDLERALANLAKASGAPALTVTP